MAAVREDDAKTSGGTIDDEGLLAAFGGVVAQRLVEGDGAQAGHECVGEALVAMSTDDMGDLVADDDSDLVIRSG
jgi:hypothetical protein